MGFPLPITSTLRILGGGTSQNVYTTTSGTYVNIATGTTAAPDTTLNPALKVSRLLSVTGSLTGVPEVMTAAQFVTVGDSSNREQVQGIIAEAENSALGSDSPSMTPDAVAVFGFGRIRNSGVGLGTGAYLEGRRDTNTGGTMGVEVRSYNNTATATNHSSSSASTTQGVWITCAGVKNGAALSIGGVSNVQWDAGIVITSVGTSGPVATVSFADYSQSATSIAINGTHATAAIAVAASSGAVIIGGTTLLDPDSLLEVQASGVAKDPLVLFGQTSSTNTQRIRLSAAAAISEWFVAGAANGVITGTATGDHGMRISGSGKAFHIGGTTKILTITAADTMGFYGTAPVAQYATTGTTTGFTAGAGTTVVSGSTFTGNTGSTAYTIGDIVRALKLYGLIAA